MGNRIAALCLLLAGCGASGPETGSISSALVVKPIDSLNVKLAGRRDKVRISKMEYIAAASSGESGATVFAADHGNRQLDEQFVAGLLVQPGQLTYTVDTTGGAATGGLSNGDTEPAIDRAMNTWSHVGCAPVAINKVAVPDFDLGFVQWLTGYGGVPGWAADITDAGWLPGSFFDLISPDGQGGSYILGVTFTFIWTDENGNPVDSNKDRHDDAAFREIYYNNNFPWTNQVVGPFDPVIDVESVVLHESGHSLGQGHFGKIFFDGAGTKEPGFQLEHLHFSPRAVMNAIYWDTQRAPLGTDKAAHCALYGTWPN